MPISIYSPPACDICGDRAWYFEHGVLLCGVCCYLGWKMNIDTGHLILHSNELPLPEGYHEIPDELRKTALEALNGNSEVTVDLKAKSKLSKWAKKKRKKLHKEAKKARKRNKK